MIRGTGRKRRQTQRSKSLTSPFRLLLVSFFRKPWQKRSVVCILVTLVMLIWAPWVIVKHLPGF
ncbi:rCG63664 [Rattus norvegicus]|uniref:RCG63664 n=1 Tax=Rattus norvegicus TaxID=10116 RepID=A6IXY4_RAT|nr:rCG63664 [Rattus norvegicus]